MSNEFFNASGIPANNADVLSPEVRSEFSAIGQGFEKLPTLTANGGKLIAVNAGGTALEAKTDAQARAIIGAFPSAGGELAGNLLFAPDATYDIGTSGATRPRDMFLSRNFAAGGNVAGATVGGAMVATQAQQETGTSNGLVVAPGKQHFHPSALKGWCLANTTGSSIAGYNVNSVTDNGTGDVNIGWGNAFSGSEAYSAVASIRSDAALVARTPETGYNAGSTRVICFDLAGDPADPSYYSVHLAGDLT